MTIPLQLFQNFRALPSQLYDTLTASRRRMAIVPLLLLAGLLTGCAYDDGYYYPSYGGYYSPYGGGYYRPYSGGYYSPYYGHGHYGHGYYGHGY